VCSGERVVEARVLFIEFRIENAIPKPAIEIYKIRRNEAKSRRMHARQAETTHSKQSATVKPVSAVRNMTMFVFTMSSLKQCMCGCTASVRACDA